MSGINHRKSVHRRLFGAALCLMALAVFAMALPPADHCERLCVEHHDGATPHVATCCMAHQNAEVEKSNVVPAVTASAMPCCAALLLNSGMSNPYLPFQPPRA